MYFIKIIMKIMKLGDVTNLMIIEFSADDPECVVDRMVIYLYFGDPL